MTEPWEQTAALSANRVEALGIVTFLHGVQPRWTESRNV